MLFLPPGCVWSSQWTGKEGYGSKSHTKHFPWLLSEAIMGRSREHILIHSSLKNLPHLVFHSWPRLCPMRKGLVNAWNPELPFQEADSPLSRIPLTLRKASNKAFGSPKGRGKERFFLFVCNFTLRNFHLKKHLLARGSNKTLEFLWLLCLHFALQTECR